MPHDPPTHPSAEQLGAFARGEVSDTDLFTIEHHLDSCAGCCRLLEGMPADPLVPILRRAVEQTVDANGNDRERALRALLQGGRGPLSAEPPSCQPGFVGGYRLLGEVGRGGMGIVYRAHHLGLNRPAALKMVLLGSLATPEQVVRFRLEAELAARVRHPNVVQVYEVGEHEGRPFLALEWVEGGSLATRLRGQPLPPREAAELVETLARAMHAAHRQGVIHRDLKPANVLLTTDGTPKIADFGLARPVEAHAALTATGALLGTPAYMAPESAAGSGECGLAVDVYALGVILYECLTGRVPFKGPTLHETLHLVVHQEPEAPRRRKADVPRDLETVCLRSLEKDPERRYATAGELAEDLGRYRRGEPVAARPVGSLERSWRWCRRNALVASLLAVVALTLVAGTTVALWLALDARDSARTARTNEATAREETRRADDEKEKALQEKEIAQQNLVTATLLRVGLIYENQPIRALWALDELPNIPEASRDAAWGYYERYCRRKVGFFVGHDATIRSVAWRGDGQVLASAGEDRTIKLWDVAAHRERATLRGHTADVLSVAWSRDGQTLASAAQDNTVILWDPATGRPRAAVQGRKGAVLAVAWTPDGRTLASASADGTIKLWDPAARREQAALEGHKGDVLALAWSPDGKTLASAGADRTIKLWDPVTNREQATLHRHTAPVHSVAWSLDGKRLASATADGVVEVWDPASRQVVSVLAGHNRLVRALAWSGDGKTLASTGDDQKIKLWDPVTGRERATLLGNIGMVHALAWGADGKTLASAGQDRTVTLWDTATTRERRTLQDNPRARARALAWSPDGQTLAAASEDRTIKLWDTAGGRVRTTLAVPAGVVWVGWSEDGKTLASVSHGGTVQLWDPATGQERATLGENNPGAIQPTAVAWSADGQTLAVGRGKDPAIQLWDVAARRERSILRGDTTEVLAVAWHPDGKTLASGCAAGKLKVWDASSGKECLTLEYGDAPILALAWSGDGRMLAAGGQDATIQLWDMAAGRQRAILLGHNGAIRALAWSVDGRTLASASADGTIKLWNAASGHQRATLEGHSDGVTWLAWSRDGKTLASAGQDQTIKLWDLDTGQKVVPLRGLAYR